MAKLMTFVMTACVVMLLLTLIGINTTAGYVMSSLGLLDNPEGFKGTSLYIAIISALGALAATSGIRIGFFGVSISDTAVAAVLAGILGAFIADFVSVITATNAVCPASASCGWITYVVVVIMGPIIVGYGISLFDWARGND